MKDIIKQYMPKHHPVKKILKENKIPAVALANFLGVTASYASAMMTGNARITPENEEKIKEFVKIIKKGAAN